MHWRFFLDLLFTLAPVFLGVLVLSLLFRLKRLWSNRNWRPVQARVVRVDTVDKQVAKDTYEERRYRLSLAFPWNGVDLRRTWMFPQTYDIPKEGDVLPLRYNPKEDDFRLMATPEERRAYARLKLWAVVILVAVVALLAGTAPLWDKVPSFAWILAPAALLCLLLLRSGRNRRSLAQRVRDGELRPIRAVVQGFRVDSEGYRQAFCRVTVQGQEQEVNLGGGLLYPYEVGQSVTLYLDPETGQVHHLPDINETERGSMLWFWILIVLAIAGQMFWILVLRSSS